MSIYIYMPASTRIAFLLCSWLNGSITDKQIIELGEWLEKSDENVKLFHRIDNPVFSKLAKTEFLN